VAKLVKWGILGNATIAGKCVIPAIQKSSNGTVHAVGTRSPENAAHVARAHTVPHVYDNYDAVLADPAVDAVYIPLPNHLHHTWTLRAFKAGKHVLCEKPLACTKAEAEEMANAATDAGLLLMEAFMYRFHPRSRRIKQIVSDGLIGKPCLVRSAFCYHMDEEVLAHGGNARLRPEMGGGALLDVGCYGISVARWLLGAEPTQVQAQATYHPDGVDVHLVGSLRFPDGGLGTIEASFVSALQQTYTVVGTEGAVELPHDAFIPWEKDAVYFMRGKDEEEGRAHVTPGIDQYQLMVEHFAEAVLGGGVLAFSPEESVRNMQALDALAKAGRSGKTVTL
jgi:predicted dehydrogenase